MRIWHLLLLEKQVRRGVRRASHRRACAHSAPPSTQACARRPMSAVPTQLEQKQVAEQSMVPKEEARRLLYGMMRAG